MIDLKDLRLLTALARHRHFAKAAEDCGMSQPAFSMRIRSFEEKLGVSIVRRGNRFQGLTEEGQMIVRRARALLDDARALEQEILASRGEITGTLVLGVVPTATAFAARLVNLLHGAHPRVLVRIEVTTSMAIQQGLLEGTLDAGITYHENLAADLLHLLPLYQERYVLLAPAGMVEADAESISWAAAAALPLSLLEPQMQNRRILDRIFESQGLKPRVVSESTGFMSAIVMAREGSVATILPQALAEGLGPVTGTRALPLGGPAQERPICLASLARQTELATVRALKAVAAGLAQ